MGDKSTAWAEGYSAGYASAMKEAAAIVRAKDREGREWVMTSLMANVRREIERDLLQRAELFDSIPARRTPTEEER